jgi:hypothetical protein
VGASKSNERFSNEVVIASGSTFRAGSRVAKLFATLPAERSPPPPQNATVAPE